MARICIGTYNVQSFRGYPEEAARATLGRGNTLAAAGHFASAFAELKCDILALQEGVTDRQIMRVADRLRMHLATFPSPLYWPGHLLSRYPITEVVQIASPRSRSGRRLSGAEHQPFSRMGGGARLQLANGATLWIVTVHLHPRDRELRGREGEVIATHVRGFLEETPLVVVLGDFNCEPDESIHRALSSPGFVNAMAAVGGGLRPTFDSTGRVSVAIDHIYVSPALASSLLGAETVRAPGFVHHGPPPDGAWLHSDHAPVLAWLRA